MSASKPFVLRWGIIGAGGISSEFVKDLVLPPSGRGVADSDVAHAVAAVGSRSVAKAEEFIQQNCPEGACAQKAGLVQTKPAAKGSYEEVYNDMNVDIILLTDSAQFEDAKDALEAGKHVLLEKPATLNRAEFEVLSELAKTKKLFLMEALWTRFFPLTFALEDVLFKEEAIGEIRRLESDFSIDFVDIVGEQNRVVNLDLAGGGLLDLGSYPLVWALLLLYRHPQNARTAPAQISATMAKYGKTGVDMHTNWTLDFPNVGIGARACLSTSIGVNSAQDVVTRIQGTKGEILLPSVTARPDKFIIRRSKVGRGPQDFVEEVKEFPIQGMGLNWEADAVARDIRDGKIENERMPHSETLLELAIFDEVRRQGGYVYPEGLEKVKLPA